MYVPGRHRGRHRAHAPEDHAGERRRRIRAQVPPQTVQSDVQRRSAGPAHRSPLLTLYRRRRERPHHVAGRVHDFQRGTRRTLNLLPPTTTTARHRSPTRYAAAGSNRCTARSVIPGWAWRSGAMLSSTQKPRAVARHRQLVVLGDHVGDGDVGKVGVELLPRLAVVVGDVDAVVGAGVEQPGAVRVLRGSS